MKTFLKLVLASIAASFCAAALAQPATELREPARFTQQELDQVLAPIALYPDSLLSQLLMAATYPADVEQAALWSRANPGLQGEDAVRAVENEPWDPSVKSLVAFPQVLARLAERLDWTRRLGDAFLAQPEQVSDTIQELRHRADVAGNLRSSEEIVVRRADDDYIIEPASPEVVYVPYYDPRVVYGPWWWPEYQPVHWSPWPDYRWHSGYGGFGWGLGVTLGSSFFYSGFDWPRRFIRFHNHRPFYHRGWNHHHGHRWWHDGRRDAHNRWRDRGHWRDGRHDGDRSRWRDRDGRHGHEGRWGDREGRRDGRGDGRWDGRRDGRGDGRRDGAGDRDGRRGEWRGRGGETIAVQPGPVARPDVQRYTGTRTSPQVRPAGQPLARPAQPRIERPVHVAPQPSPVARPQHVRPAPVERAPRAEVQRPQPQVERAHPRAESPRAAPASRPERGGGGGDRGDRGDRGPRGRDR